MCVYNTQSQQQPSVEELVNKVAAHSSAPPFTSRRPGLGQKAQKGDKRQQTLNLRDFERDQQRPERRQARKWNRVLLGIPGDGCVSHYHWVPRLGVCSMTHHRHSAALTGENPPRCPPLTFYSTAIYHLLYIRQPAWLILDAARRAENLCGGIYVGPHNPPHQKKKKKNLRHISLELLRARARWISLNPASFP